MSQTEETKTEVEPVEVTNKYDVTQLKNAVDDELARYYSKEKKYMQSHAHTDVRLFLGYVSCFIAGGAFLYEYKTSFNEALPTTTICVIVYWIIQAIAFGYSYLIEKDEIFVGNIKENGKVTETLKISGKLDKYSPKYEFKFTFIDKSCGKIVNHQVEPNIATWFTEKGIMVSEAIDKDLESYLTLVKNKLHQN